VRVLDTNTISYYFRGDPAVTSRLQTLIPSEVAVPAIVEYELRYGLQRLPEVAVRLRVEALNTFLKPLAILPFDSRSAQHAAVIRAELEAAGTPIGPHDLLIAAIALRHGATLITRNVREFSRVPGLLWENWHDH
jgi:tRNA(fMet)-specific endonuclease VapC